MPLTLIAHCVQVHSEVHYLCSGISPSACVGVGVWVGVGVCLGVCGCGCVRVWMCAYCIGPLQSIGATCGNVLTVIMT